MRPEPGARMRCGFSALLVLWLAGPAAATHHKHHHRVPLLQLNGAEQILGTLREDERVVSLSPHLAIFPESGPVCRYELSAADGAEVPFEAEVTDKAQGLAVVRVKAKAAPLDCAHAEYALRLVAVRCADELARSEPVPLRLTVKDTNNHAPEFAAPWYAFDVVEGGVNENIARLATTDKDCGHPYGKVCRYEITNALEGFPFRIDDQGVLSNTRPLNRSDAESHILTVVAYDCGMQRSKSTLVTINVRRACREGLRGVPDAAAQPLLQVRGGGAPQRLLPDAELVSCPRSGAACTVKAAEARLELDVPRAAAPRDLAAVRKCGMDLATLELLPRAAPAARDVLLDREGKAKQLLLASDELLGREDDESEDDDEDDEDVSSAQPSPAAAAANADSHVFDGKSRAVPVTALKAVVPEKFTLAFSMKHVAGTPAEQAVKENILCESDVESLNRHHFAVYLRHCKLEMLLRREAAHASPEFRAAEWRWALPEVCDGEWHSYALLFADLDNVQLFVDGKKFDTTDRNPEILDDWPLHDMKWLKTKTTVGACWHGRSGQNVQFFKGHLASMYLLPGKVESEAAVQCLHQPKERLRFDAVDELVPGETATFSEQQTRLVLKSNTLEDLSLLLQKVAYVGGEGAGKRRLTLHAQAQCTEGGAPRPLATYSAAIQLLPDRAPLLSISGQNLINLRRAALKTGAVMLPDVQITATEAKDGTDVDVTSKHSLDWCKIHLKPSRDMDLEYFSSPAALIASLNIDFEHDAEGILLKGEETVAGYREVLAKIHYFNTRPDSYNKRMYTVQCAMNKGKLLSNKFFVTMNVESGEDAPHLLQKEEEAGELKEQLGRRLEPSAFDQLGANRLQNILEMDLPRPKALLSHHGYEMGQGAVAGGAVAIVVVICVGFLLVLLVVGLLKMRDTPLPHARRRQRKSATTQLQEGMEWDDGGMNITVNPLEDVEKQEPEVIYSEDEESSDDGESYHDEDDLSEDEDEETTPALPHAANRPGLEWDDEAGLNSGLPHTYRV